MAQGNVIKWLVLFASDTAREEEMGQSVNM